MTDEEFMRSPRCFKPSIRIGDLIGRLQDIALRAPDLEVVFIDDGHRSSIARFERDEDETGGVKYLILKGDWI
jgi:hypothetical protein